MQELGRQTGVLGYVRPQDLQFPHGMVVTWTIGKSKVATSQATKIIIPAAKELLRVFTSATRIVDEKEVQLIEAFAEHSHPMWQFNNVYNDSVERLPTWQEAIPEGDIAAAIDTHTVKH